MSVALGNTTVTDDNALPVRIRADARESALKSLQVTLSGTPETVTSIEVPDVANGVRIYPQAQAIRFAVNENPAAIGTETTVTGLEADWTVGGIAHADAWEVRLLEPGTSRTLRMTSLVASVVVELELF